MATPQQKGGRASMESAKVSAAKIQVYLKGIDYPADKNELVDHAEENGAPDEVMAILRQLADKQYTSPADVEKEFGRIKSAARESAARESEFATSGTM